MIFYTDLPLLPEGTECEITELDETPEWTLTSDRTVTLTASTTSPVTANFVNERTSGSLAITKTVESPEGVDLSAEEFEVTVTCSGGFTEDPYLLTGVISEVDGWVIPNLPYGAECRAVETADERFTTSYSADAVPIAAKTSTIDVLNQTGSVHVDIQTVVSDARPFDPDDDFTIAVTCSNAGEVIFDSTINLSTVDGFVQWEAPLLPTGATCQTSLDPSVAWALTGATGDATNENVISQTIGTDVAWNAFDVERLLGTLTVTKLLEDIPFGADFTTEEFEMTVTCSDGFIDAGHQLGETLLVSTVNPLLVTDLPVGAECTLAEVENPFFNPSFAPSPTFIVSPIAEGNAIDAIAVTNIATQALSTFLEEQQPPPPTLAFTGRTASELVRMALLLLAVGGFILFGRRRREEAPV